jgi:2-polyprenyl-3-methyl-5-hydroxy-6-metoxy-1,4-benzoquinol methylase
MDTLQETIMHVGDAVELIKQGKVGQANQPTTMDIMKSIYGDYQQAFVADDFTLTPDGYSVGKWAVIQRAAKELNRQQFSWLDLGACYGIFGFMLAQEYQQSTGVLNNIVQAELVANRFAAHVKGISDRVKTQDCSWKDCTGTYDLVCCMSLVHHLLGSGHTVKTFCDGLKKLVNPGGILVLEVPLANDFQGSLLVKTHLGHCVDVEDFIPELPEFELLWKEKVDYAGNSDINRNVGVFRRVA